MGAQQRQRSATIYERGDDSSEQRVPSESTGATYNAWSCSAAPSRGRQSSPGDQRVGLPKYRCSGPCSTCSSTAISCCSRAADKIGSDGRIRLGLGWIIGPGFNNARGPA